MRAANRNNLAWWLALMAGLKSIAGAGALTDVIPAEWAGLFLAFSSALDVATTAYIAAVKPVADPGQEALNQTAA
jgi:hypothetical protein